LRSEATVDDQLRAEDAVILGEQAAVRIRFDEAAEMAQVMGGEVAEDVFGVAPPARGP